MIRAFFGLTDFPFKKESEKIFVSRQISYLRKRCAHFIETQGIALLTGEVGSGKTTFIRHFLKELNHNIYKYFYLSQTIRNARAFYRLLAFELGLTPMYRLEDLTSQVKNELAEIFHKQRLQPVLVIDEAQNLSDTVLEEIRLLTNFKMDSKNYLSVFLLGHPVLKARLKLPPYAALKQRISFNYHLTGLEQDEVAPYIAHRLKEVGAKPALFTTDAMTLSFNYAKGLLRVINLLSLEGLYRAADQGKNMVDEKLIENIIQGWDNL